LSFTLRKKAARSTNDSDSSQAMRCDWRAISLKFFSRAAVVSRRSTSHRVHPVPDDPGDQLRIRQAGLAC
jgi:hypothetical protein